MISILSLVNSTLFFQSIIIFTFKHTSKICVVRHSVKLTDNQLNSHDEISFFSSAVIFSFIQNDINQNENVHVHSCNFEVECEFNYIFFYKMNNLLEVSAK